VILAINSADPIDLPFNQPLLDAVKEIAEYELVNYTEIPPLEDLSRYEAIVISGVPLHYPFSSVEDRLPYFQWVKEIDLPVLGICLGHQIVGKLFGSTVIQNTEAENGDVLVQVKGDDSLFTGLPAQVNTRMLHRASITLPDSFILLGSSPDCNNVIMKHKTRSIYGLQFHPEMSKDGPTLLSNFLSLVGSAPRLVTNRYGN
jgi:GMP synthase (glutamine-hydrolysing)